MPELPYEVIPQEFRDHVEQVLRTEWMGKEVERRWGQTRLGQYYVFVTSKYIWYAVRLIVDEEHRDLELDNNERYGLYKDEFFWLENCRKFVRENLAKFVECDFIETVHKIRKLPVDAYFNPQKYLKPGDHIQRYLLNGVIPLNHEGVYLGGGEVCHIRAETASLFDMIREAHARIDTFQNFVGSQDTEVRVIVYCFPPRVSARICSTARRLADHRYREGEYNFLKKNCQHFASYCVLGFEWSSDIAIGCEYVKKTFDLLSR